MSPVRRAVSIVLFGLLCTMGRLAAQDQGSAPSAPPFVHFEHFVPMSGPIRSKDDRKWRRAIVRLAETQREEFPDRIDLPFRSGPSESSIATLRRGREADLEITISRNGALLACVEADLGRLREVGTVALASEGAEHVFFIAEAGGTVCRQTTLCLVTPDTRELVGLALDFALWHPVHKVTSLSCTPNLLEKRFERELEFLLDVRFDYGFVSMAEADRRATDPEYAFYFWDQDNARVENGSLRIRRFPVPLGANGRYTHHAFAAETRFSAWDKVGVVAYDRMTDEHFVVYCLANPGWITGLSASNGFLAVGTDSGEIAVLRIRDYTLRRIPFGEAVATLVIEGEELVINGTNRLHLPPR